MPYFKHNLLNFQPKPPNSDRDHLKEYLKRTIMKQKRSKLNQRIMKCIDLSDNENQQIKEMYERKTNHSHFKEDIETYSKINDRI